jgi:hypothetical protein
LGAACVLVLGACGDDASVTGAPTPAPPTPAPPTPTPAATVLQAEQALPAPAGKGNTLAWWTFTTPAAGTIDVTVGYLHDDSQILVWVTDRACNKWQFERDECFYLTKSLEGPRPRKLQATGVRVGSYTLFVANDGPHDEQIDCRVTLTLSSGGDGRLTAGPPARSFDR